MSCPIENYLIDGLLSILMEDLERLREGWLELVKSCRLEEAGSYYWGELFPYVEKRFLENNKMREEYDWLILPAGLDLFYNKKVILDLTRGKRIMSVGAGIVGAFFGFDLVYVDEEWIDEIKRGKPGTEKLVTVKNPFEVFGDLEGQEARELFNHYDYGAAIYFYKKLR